MPEQLRRLQARLAKAGGAASLVGDVGSADVKVANEMTGQVLVRVLRSSHEPQRALEQSVRRRAPARTARLLPPATAPRPARRWTA